MALSQNYIGRSIDFCALDTNNEPGLQPVSVGVLTSGSAISGPYKVAQKFFKYMFTEKGSVAAEPEYGTNFIGLLFGGYIQNEPELKLRFYQEASFGINYVRGSNLNPSLDENLIAVDLSGFDISGDYATIRLRFTFEDQSTILTPITISTI